MSPQRSLKPCSKSGCPNLHREPGGLCPEHSRQHKLERSRDYDKNRPSASRRGYGYRWQKYRLLFLAKNPLCVECLAIGRVKPAKDVDHIVAVSGPDDPLFWQTSNHQALCHGHHSTKTAKENGAFGNRG